MAIIPNKREKGARVDAASFARYKTKLKRSDKNVQPADCEHAGDRLKITKSRVGERQ